MRKLISLLLLTCFTIGSSIHAKDLGLNISQINKNGLYSTGDKITWTIKIGRLDSTHAKKIKYTVKLSGKKILKKGTADLTISSPTISVVSEKPGSMILTIYAGNKHQCSGALISYKEIKPSQPKPSDFDEFWKSKLAEQDKVPMNTKLTPETTDKNFNSWIITMDTIRGQKIHGRLARPIDGKKFPAILKLQYAGVYGLNSGGATNDAKKGWLSLNIIAHDIPVNKNKEYYLNLKNSSLKSYTRIGNTDRETSYFLRMCLACSRAVDYISTRPDWDGKTIVVLGGSQGGYQSIVAAGLNSKVTAIMAMVPAGCDLSGPVANRAVSWPYWWSKKETDPKIKNTARYFDAINFAYNIKCPALIGFGLGDETSRAEGVMAAINVMKGKTKLIIQPNGEHQGSGRKFYTHQSNWKKALFNGKDVIPLKK